jgi:ribosomal-protein-alanine N-acetyltransferase
MENEKGLLVRFRFVAMDGARVRAIAGWRYAGEYAFYDLVNNPDDLAEFLAPENWGGMYHAALDEAGELMGFLQTKLEGQTVEIGLGLRPDLTGQGLGLGFVEACLGFARERFRPAHFRLAVAAFNRRALRVYERAGFRAVAEYWQRTNGGEHWFVRMEREA